MVMDDAPSPDRDDEAALVRLQVHAKQELRARMRSVRRVLPLAACAGRSSLANARVAELPEFVRARTVIGYSAIRKELDPTGLLARAASLGKRVGLPRVQDDHLQLHVYESSDSLEESQLGMLEPLPSTAVIDHSEVDLIVVPALALDARGYRIGYGRAFYDRLLPTLVNAFYVGVAYDFQLVPELPRQPHDVAMHCVISDARTLRV
jgi:5-formyltetrahydrofolate cyclo-ligase